MRPSRFFAGVATASAIIALTGCTAGGPSGTPFGAALHGTPATEQSTTYFAFSDISRAAAMDAYESIIPDLVAASIIGYDAFGPYFHLVPEVLPDPEADGATATSYGIAPDSVTRFTGVADAAGTFGGISGERTELSGGTLLQRRDDYEIDFDDEDFPASMVSRLNSVWYNDGTVIAGSSRGAVEEWVSAKGDSLGSTLPGVESCLGNPLGALIASGDYARTTGTAAIGVSDTEDGAFVQTLCLRTDDAEALIAVLTENLASGTALTARPFSEILGSATIEDTGEGWVRMTSEDGLPGSFFQILQTGDLERLTRSE